MPDRTVLHEINAEHTDLQRSGVSDASPVAVVIVAGDDLAPAAPGTPTVNPIPEGIKLEWVNPTLNADGTTCVDLRWAKIYYNATAGVSKSVNDGHYIVGARAGENQAFSDTNITAGTARYYVVTAMDGSGNESLESDEVNTTGGAVPSEPPDIPGDASGHVFDDTKGVEGVAIGDGMLGIIFKHRASNWVKFDRYRLWYAVDTGTGFGPWTEIIPVNQTAYLHKGLTKTYSYRYKATIVANGIESTTPDRAKADGTGYLPNASDNSAIVAELILAENIVAANEVRGEHFFAQSYLAINSDVFGTDGIQLQYNAGNPRAYIGDGGNSFLQFDGTDLSWKGVNTELTAAGAFIASSATITGTVTSTSGAIGGWAIGATTLIGGNLTLDSGNTRIIAGTGTDVIAIDAADATYRLAIGHSTYAFAPFRVTKAGAVVASNATITGSITITGGVGLGNLADAGALATLDAVDYVTQITGAKPPSDADNTSTVITGGLITTGTIQLSDGTAIKAGITGDGMGDGQIRLWAGDTWANRASAPFRVTQGGALVATNATITGSITISSGSGIGNLADAGALATLDAVDYVTQITGAKPPSDADNTSTVITGGLITTGTIQLSDGTAIKAGITGDGMGDGQIRLWAGDTWANRASAPFRVTQGGALVATSATITGSITITGGVGLGNLADATADSIAETTTKKWAGQTGADVTDYLDPRVANALSEHNVLTIQRPLGATFSGGQNATGAIVVRLPQSWTNTMMRFAVEVFDFMTERSFELHLGGYNNIGSASWVHETANLVGSTAADNRVRFGHDGTRCCIVIGETTSVWQHPQIHVSNFQAGFNNFALDQWDNDWSISLVANLTGYAFTADFPDALIDAAAIRNQGVLATRNTIASTHIDANAVTTPKVAANAITADKVAANAITADKINVSTLSAITANMGTLTAGTIRVPNTGWRVQITSGGTVPLRYWNGVTDRFRVDRSGNVAITGAITISSGSGIGNLTDAGELATRNTIASTHIDANAVTTPKVAANAITANKINVSTLSAITANMGTLTAGTIRVPNTSIGWRVQITSGGTVPLRYWNGVTDRFRVDRSGNVAIAGAITIFSGSGVGNLADAGELATRNTIASTHIDANAVTTPKVAANAITADKINVSTLSAITANMGTLNAGTISVAGGLVQIGTDVYGTADGIYVGAGGTIIITDAAGSVIFDANSTFQGARIIDAGFLDPTNSAATWVWTNRSGTVPTGKKWVISTSNYSALFSNMNVGVFDDIWFVQGGVFRIGTVYHHELAAGTYTNNIDVQINHAIEIKRDDGTWFRAYPDTAWLILEVPI